MNLVIPELEAYASAHTTPESEALRALNRETYLKVLMPHMLSGHVQGAALSMFSQMLRPRRVLEIGTFTGYSAICLAQGLTPDGLLYTIDVNEELEDLARQYFAAAGLAEKIRFLVGKALDIIPTLNETFDLVFIDADKLNYAQYYHLCKSKVRQGGFIIADNVLWSGKVTDPKAQDKDTNNMRAFNQLIHDDPEVENLLLPLRDGLMIARKL